MHIFRTVEDHGHTSCTIEFPEIKVMTAEQAFTWYTFSLGFAIPVAAISVFYFLVVVRLGRVGAVQQTKGKLRVYCNVCAICVIFDGKVALQQIYGMVGILYTFCFVGNLPSFYFPLNYLLTCLLT